MCCQPPPPDRSRRGPALTGTTGIAVAVLVLILLLAVAAAATWARSNAQETPRASTAAAVEALASLTPEVRATPKPALLPARLSLESRPEGATVSVDGVERGKTPLLIDNLGSGNHQVALSLADRQLYRTSVFLSPNETKKLSIDLPPTPLPTPSPPPIPTGTFYPLAVMVENFVDARPQSGLDRADIVYEALVEGGISRFLAVYVDGQADAIGPVRSARHYYVYLAAELNASYVHIGASPEGYAALNATGITNLDETYGDPGFWRDGARSAPHNAYTSTDLLRSSLKKVRRVTPGSAAGFHFRTDPQPVQGRDAKGLSIQYAPDYRVEYRYSPEDRLYRRFMDGLPHKDADTGEQVAPRNLVVQIVEAWVIDSDGRLDMAQVGEGKALYFRDGVVTEGSWHKPSYGKVTEWYDADGRPALMNPGKIWVQMVPPGTPIEY